MPSIPIESTVQKKTDRFRRREIVNSCSLMWYMHFTSAFMAVENANLKQKGCITSTTVGDLDFIQTKLRILSGRLVFQ